MDIGLWGGGGGMTLSGKMSFLKDPVQMEDVSGKMDFLGWILGYKRGVWVVNGASKDGL